jgi:hypothetical protein
MADKLDGLSRCGHLAFHIHLDSVHNETYISEWSYDSGMGTIFPLRGGNKISAATYSTVMTSTAMDHDLYMILREIIGIQAALMASLK